MIHQVKRFGLASLAAGVLLAAGPMGCGAGGPGGGGTGDGGSDEGSSLSESEPNNSFQDAEKAIFNSATTSRISATLSGGDDIDVYDIGPISRGDRILVDVSAETENLDLVAGVYDEDGQLFANNDDRDLERGLLDPLVDEVARHDGDAYFLAIARSAFAGPTPTAGRYEITIQVFAGNVVPDTKTQIVLLNYEGGEVGPDNLLVDEVEPFDAGAISQFYDGEDDLIKLAIMDTVRQNYRLYNVEFYDDAASLPAGEEFATIMMGSQSSRAFGIAESVDAYNAQLMDTAIIFTESFTPNQFSSAPSAEELGVAIGNIVAHELGHLMGLNHVDDELALMDAVSPADTFLADQEFRISPLSGDILLLGDQNAPRLLSESVGLVPGAEIPREKRRVLPAGPRLRRKDVTSWCGTCGRKAEALQK